MVIVKLRLRVVPAEKRFMIRYATAADGSYRLAILRKRPPNWGKMEEKSSKNKMTATRGPRVGLTGKCVHKSYLLTKNQKKRY